jgi:hypothetical protein
VSNYGPLTAAVLAAGRRLIEVTRAVNAYLPERLRLLEVGADVDAQDHEIALAEWEARRDFRGAALRAEAGYAAGEEEEPHPYVMARLLAELDQSEAEGDDAFRAYCEAMEER